MTASFFGSFGDVDNLSIWVFEKCNAFHWARQLLLFPYATYRIEHSWVRRYSSRPQTASVAFTPQEARGWFDVISPVLYP